VEVDRRELLNDEVEQVGGVELVDLLEEVVSLEDVPGILRLRRRTRSSLSRWSLLLMASSREKARTTGAARWGSHPHRRRRH
jgi:hypothetical protein